MPGRASNKFNLLRLVSFVWFLTSVLVYWNGAVEGSPAGRNVRGVGLGVRCIGLNVSVQQKISFRSSVTYVVEQRERDRLGSIDKVVVSIGKVVERIQLVVRTKLDP